MDGPGAHFVFVVEPGFTMQAFSSAIEVLRLARKLGAPEAFSYGVATVDDRPAAASNGIEILPNCGIDDIPKGAIVIAVAGARVAQQANPLLINRLRRWARQGHPIWAISSGVVRLAQAGLIDGCRVAAHWEDVPYLRENHPQVDVSISLFILDSKHPTCSGGGAAADLMLSFIGCSAVAGLVDEVASRLMIDGVRDGRMRQSFPAELRYSTSNRTVFSAIRLMEANLYETLPLHEIAAGVGVSQRQLERLFKEEFLKTPKSVYLELRLGEVRQEVLAGRRPFIDVALDYGFTPENLTRVYRRVFGALPSEERKKRARSAS